MACTILQFGNSYIGDLQLKKYHVKDSNKVIFESSVLVIAFRYQYLRGPNA